MIFKQAILCAFVWSCCVTCSAGRDVASVSFRGDCTNFGMKIVSAGTHNQETGRKSKSAGEQGRVI